MLRLPGLVLVAFATTLGCNALTGVDELELVDCLDCGSTDAEVDTTQPDTAPPPDTSVAEAESDTALDGADADADAADTADAEEDTSWWDAPDGAKFCKGNLACNDGNACTDDLCVSNVCENRVIDKDGDGEAPTSAGSCGLDCYDGNKDVHSKQTNWFVTPYTTAAGITSYDYDCNGTEELQYTALAKCVRVTPTLCAPTAGWNATVAPGCGIKATWMTSCSYSSLSGTCVLSTTTRQQGCR